MQIRVADHDAELGPEKRSPKAREAGGALKWMRGKATEFRQQLGTLRDSPRELWLTYLLKILESYSYFAVVYVLVLLLTDELGFTDSQAGWIYGSFGAIFALASALMGTIVDYLGVRRSLLVGGAVLTASRLALALTPSRPATLAIVLFFLPIGSALGIPVMAAGVKRYTTEAGRAFGYSLFYIAMNVSAFAAALLVDAFRFAVGPGPAGGSAAALGGLLAPMTAYRWLILSSAAASAVFFLIAALFVREIEVDESGGTSAFETPSAGPGQLAREVFTSRRFWRFALLACILVGTRSVMYHLSSTFAKYAVREIDAAFPFGSVIAIDPLVIVVLVPLVAAFHYRRATPFQSIALGACVTALAPLFLVAGPSYPSAVAFVLVLAVGEAVWSPRLYEYTCAAAPVGREGTYASLAVVPLFAAKLLAGATSGPLLDAFCPAEGPRNARLAWLCVAASAAASALLLFAFRGVIERRDEEGGGFERLREGPDVPCAAPRTDAPPVPLAALPSAAIRLAAPSRGPYTASA